MISPFLLDSRSKGGLGLSTSEVGIIYGTVGIAAIMMGGLLGGYAIYRKGLRYCLWIMVFAIHIPDLAFIYLSQVLPENFFLIGAAVGAEQFGYGFGLTAYTMYMILISEGDYKTVFFAVATGIMALGMMLPGMWSGWLQEQLGYRDFFLWIMLSTIPGFIVPAFVKIKSGYGKKAT